MSKTALWKSWPQNHRKCKKCTFDYENVKKVAKKYQNVHLALGNPDPKIIESGNDALLMRKTKTNHFCEHVFEVDGEPWHRTTKATWKWALVFPGCLSVLALLKSHFFRPVTHFLFQIRILHQIWVRLTVSEFCKNDFSKIRKF